MKVAVFTSNHPRHLSLLQMLTLAGHEVTAVIEPKPWVAPISTALNLYWAKVDYAEHYVFGGKRLVRVPALVCRWASSRRCPPCRPRSTTRRAG